MSDSVKKYFENNPSVGHFGSNAKEFSSKSIETYMNEMQEENKTSISVDKDLILVNKLLALSNEQKLLDIDQALKEYEGNVVDKWQLINRIEEIMSR
jgi:hypothetical protein